MGTANVQVDEEVRKRGGSSQEDTGMAGVEGTFKLLTRAATTCLGTMGLLGVEFHGFEVFCPAPGTGPAGDREGEVRRGHGPSLQAELSRRRWVAFAPELKQPKQGKLVGAR